MEKQSEKRRGVLSLTVSFYTSCIIKDNNDYQHGEEGRREAENGNTGQ